MKRAGLTIACLILLALAARSWLHADVVRRHSQVIDDLPPYGEELRRVQPLVDAITEDNRYSGRGSYRIRSPDGERVAVTLSWNVPSIPIGFVTDRPFLHTVAVWDESTKRLRRVVSVMETDPHSGFSHRYTWSLDSKALLIHGTGRLPENYEDVRDLCVVYLPREDVLYRLRNCPPTWILPSPSSK